MDFNRKILIVITLLLLCGCGISKRQVRKKQVKELENIFLIEKKHSKGEVIVLSAPKTPVKRFIDTVVVYKGDSGVHVTTMYDKRGFVEHQVINCPDIVEEKKTIKNTEKQVKEKETKREIDKKAIAIIIVLFFIGIGVLYFFAKKRPSLPPL